eukprot:scaffold267280_cov30-Tisochrysis_lutea.AAC.9
MFSKRPTSDSSPLECSMMWAPYNAGSSESTPEPCTLTLRVSKPTSARSSTGRPSKKRGLGELQAVAVRVDSRDKHLLGLLFDPACRGDHDVRVDGPVHGLTQPKLARIRRRRGIQGGPRTQCRRAVQVERATSTAEHLSSVDGQFRGGWGAMQRDHSFVQERLGLGANCERAALHKDHVQFRRRDVEQDALARGNHYGIPLDGKRAAAPCSVARPQVNIRVSCGGARSRHAEAFDTRRTLYGVLRDRRNLANDAGDGHIQSRGRIAKASTIDEDGGTAGRAATSRNDVVYLGCRGALELDALSGISGRLEAAVNRDGPETELWPTIGCGR